MIDLIRGAGPVLIGVVAAGLVLAGLGACSASSGTRDADPVPPATGVVEATIPASDAAAPGIETATFALG